MEKKKSSREMTLELWRFFFCFSVVMMHLCVRLDVKLFSAGYLGVEFFFILSGYGVAMFFQKHLAGQAFPLRVKGVGSYALSRIKKLYPMYVCAVAIMFLFNAIWQKLGVRGTLTAFKEGWPEFFWLQCQPFGGNIQVVSDWYVPAMFWGSLAVLIVLILVGEKLALVVCPLLALAGYGYFFKLICKIDVIFSYYPVIRAIAGLSLGAFVCLLTTLLKKKERKPHGAIAVALYVMANVALVCMFAMTHFGHRGWTDFLFIGIFALSIFVLVCVELPLPERAKKWFGRLGGITYPIYIFHLPVIDIILTLCGRTF